MEKRLGITLGDVAGIGPEITLKIGKEYLNQIIVYGSFDVLTYYKNRYRYDFVLNKIIDPLEAKDDVMNIIDQFPISIEEFAIGKLSAECGKRAYLYLEKAIKDALDEKIGAIVTCPLNKEALHKAGYNYAGHTEILASLTNTNEYGMLLWSDKLKVIHVSTHCSLRQAIERVQKERIIKTTLLAYETLKRSGIAKPKIAIAGLNPHAGENGLFGTEEIQEIIPAIHCLQEQGLDVKGPFPPDTVFLKCLKKEYDLVVAMYHDQGHIPLKLLDFDGGVNVTVGLPIIRTSVDHGTAFDIAGTNVADPSSLIKALKLAKKLS